MAIDRTKKTVESLARRIIAGREKLAAAEDALLATYSDEIREAVQAQVDGDKSA